MAEQERVLIVAPHPDDDIIGCAGRIIRHTENNAQVYIVYITSGDAGSITIPKEELANTREQEAIAAEEELGVPKENLIFLRVPDGEITYHEKDNVTELAKIIRSKKPHYLYIPCSDDAYSDHIACRKQSLEAAERASGPYFRELSDTPWNVGNIVGYEVGVDIRNPQYREDITASYERIMRAMKRHKSQQEGNWIEKTRSLHEYRGSRMGQGRKAQVFQISRISKI